MSLNLLSVTEYITFLILISLCQMFFEFRNNMHSVIYFINLIFVFELKN